MGKEQNSLFKQESQNSKTGGLYIIEGSRCPRMHSNPFLALFQGKPCQYFILFNQFVADPWQIVKPQPITRSPAMTICDSKTFRHKFLTCR